LCIICGPHFARDTATVTDGITLSACPFTNFGLRLTAGSCGGTSGAGGAPSGGSATAASGSPTGRMTGAGKTLQSTGNLFEVLLAKVEGIRLTPIAERNRIRRVDVAVLQVASNDNLRDAGH
jgi:hypothetical protein